MLFKKGAEVNPESSNSTAKAALRFIEENLIFPPPPSLPGYEKAQYFRETFLEFPSHVDPITVTLSRSESSIKSQKKETGANVSKNQNKNIVVSAGSKMSDVPLDPVSVESQLNFALHILRDQFQMNPAYYSHSMFSCAIQGKALAILERRSIAWTAEPCSLLPESRKLFESPLPRPPSPWEVNVDEYLPKRLAMPFDISIEVPESTVYRMCFKCKGSGLLNTDTETILCSTCLGLSSLRLSIRLRVYWYPKTIFHSDLNGYNIPEKLLSLVDDVDPNKYQALTRYYKNTLLKMLSEFVPKGIRLKQCSFELRAIPLIEIIFSKKAKKMYRFLVCGEQRKAAILLNPKKH